MKRPKSNILKENDIRPDNLKKGQLKRFMADIRMLRSFKKEFVKVPCPACQSLNAAYFFEKFGLDYNLCNDCETVYMSPRPTARILDKYYQFSQNYRYWNEYIFPASENARRQKIFKPRVQRVKELCRKYGVERNLLLEIGSGFGTFCEEMSKSGFFKKIIAVEPTPSLAATCKKRGLTVIDKPIEKINPGSLRADVIVSFEVIEHLFSPIKFISLCNKLLRRNGLLIITCPNVQGFEASILGRESDTFDNEHMNYFHPASISNLLDSCGFEILEVTTPGKLDVELVRKKIINGKFDIKGSPLLKDILIDNWVVKGEKFQKIIERNGFSSHMWTLARKPGK